MEQRIRELVDLLNAASDAYYNGKEELMSNLEWDAAFDELSRLEDESGIILPNSPTQRVSEDDTPGEKVTHEYSALSLAKTKDPAALVKWADGRPVWMSWKCDGLTLVLYYDDIPGTEGTSKLTRVVTRGNGIQGTDVTRFAPYIAGIPMEINHRGHMVVRGEALISNKDFETVNETLDEPMANARNAAAGAFTLHSTKEFAARKVQFIAFTLVHVEEDVRSWGKRMDLLDSLGFRTVQRRPYEAADVTKGVDEFTELVETGQCDYPVDGLVLAYDDTVYAAGGSVTQHHATRAGFAFKWADEQALTKLKYIEWSCAANAITPVAVFEPVQLAGTTVQRASLSNVGECRRIGIGGEGSELSVYKANMIIPRVASVTRKVGEFTVPTHCPACGMDTELHVSSSGAETLHCTNPNCPGKQIKKFTRFVSKDGMDIDGMSKETVRTFISHGLLKDFSDIYSLYEHAQEIKQMEGFGETSVNSLMSAIERSKDVEAPKFLYSLCIPMCGHDVSKKIFACYTMAEFMDKISESIELGAPDAFASIDGIGPEKSSALSAWFANKGNAVLCKKLLDTVRVHDIERVEAGNRCEGLIFVVTGDVHHYGNRNEFKAYVESQGGKVTGSVTKKTSYLINNDATSTTGKNMKAKELGVPIITEDEFLSQFG